MVVWFTKPAPSQDFQFASDLLTSCACQFRRIRALGELHQFRGEALNDGSRSTMHVLQLFGTLLVVVVVGELSSFANGEGINGVANVGTYPGYVFTKETGKSLKVRGTVAVQNNGGSTGIIVTGTLVGLDQNVTGGVHIHSGVSCDSADYVGGHYYDTSTIDPWLTTTYTSDENGVATVNLSMSDFTLTGDYPVAGRCLVVHDACGCRIGCGVIESTPGEVVQLKKYPGLSAPVDYRASGTLLVTDSNSGGIDITGTIGGLEPSAQGGLHVHSGYTCSSDIYGDQYQMSVGGHYWEGLSSDPWTTMYSSNSNGYWHNSINRSEFTVNDAFAVAYRTVVVHMPAPSGTRLGCGVIDSNLDTSTATVGDFAALPTSDNAKKRGFWTKTRLEIILIPVGFVFAFILFYTYNNRSRFGHCSGKDEEAGSFKYSTRSTGMFGESVEFKRESSGANSK